MPEAVAAEVLDEPGAPADEVTEELEVTEDPAAETEAEGDDDEVVVTIGGESPPPEDEDKRRAPEWTRELRKRYEDVKRENAELRQLTQTTAPEQAAVGAEPELEQFDYDQAKFKDAWRSWNQRKQVAENQVAENTRKTQAAQTAWQTTLTSYETQKAALKVRDAADTEAVAKDILSPVQQGLILQGAENPAMLVYALGKNPTKAKELAAISDPVKFSFAVAKLETQVKATPRKAAPLPEKRMSGSAPISGAMDSRLAQLEAAADKTGDRSGVLAYRTALRNRAK